MASVTKRPEGIWRAVFTCEGCERHKGVPKQHTTHHARKTDAQDWLDEQTAALLTGKWTDTRNARITVGQWCDRWLEGYAVRKSSTVRQARTHVARIKEAFGGRKLRNLKPSDVKAWTGALADGGAEPSYVYALHARLSQILTDAVHDGLLPRNPCSRRTAPPAGRQRAFIATTDQMWALHDAMPEHLRPAILLGAFAGLRVAEVCGLRVADVDFLRAVIAPAVQYPAEDLKTDESKTPIPVARELVEALSASMVGRPASAWVIADEAGGQVGPWQVQRAVRAARAAATYKDAEGEKIEGLPEEFRFHDLRHYYASLLISEGSDVKVVQARLRHASAKTTLDTYAHLWPDTEESTRTATGKVLAARVDSSWTKGSKKAPKARNLADQA
jgi:integrase